MVKELKLLLAEILDSQTIKEDLTAAQQLALFFENLVAEESSPSIFKNSKETTINGGVALSSKHALDCLRDPLRTIRFIKGTYEAIKDVMLLYPNEKIELLYAGCGPVAPIAITLLSDFSPDELGITLLDINESSINSVKQIIQKLNLNLFFSNIHQTDATQYKFQKNKKLHIVLTETMDKGLTVEPQVRVTQNLAPQLVDGGILIPEKINIYTEHSFLAKETIFDGVLYTLEKQSPYKVKNQQLLFSIARDIDNVSSFNFLSEPIKKPTEFKKNPDICIFAEVVVYKKQKLKKSQSFISNPICINNLYNIESPSYQLIYETKGIPNWKLKT